MNKRFLVPVLALAGFGLPVGASILEYCSGLGCGASTHSALTNDVATDGYTFQGLQTFVLSSVSGHTYSDTTAGLVFTDLGVWPVDGQSGDSIAGTATLGARAEITSSRLRSGHISGDFARCERAAAFVRE
jgi:hypothetical protein